MLMKLATYRRQSIKESWSQEKTKFPDSMLLQFVFQHNSSFIRIEVADHQRIQDYFNVFETSRFQDLRLPPTECVKDFDKPSHRNILLKLLEKQIEARDYINLVSEKLTNCFFCNQQTQSNFAL